MPALLHSKLQTQILQLETHVGAPQIAEAASDAPPPPNFDLPPGTRLQNGAWVLEEVLGRGGFGITYRARDCRNGRAVAIKEFFPTSCGRLDKQVQPRGATHNLSAPPNAVTALHFADGKQQFLEEARVLMSLRHPNIVRVQGAFEENSTAYIVMEHLEGQTLFQRVETGGALEVQAAVAVIEKIAHALEVVHRLGMLHLDIKPENVFECEFSDHDSDLKNTRFQTSSVTETSATVAHSKSESEIEAREAKTGERNPARRIVLMDFDLMRRIEGAATYQTRPLSHTSHCGTPGYAPLEQYTQGARKGAHTDIYALGATLHHLLTGDAPPAATDRAHRELMHRGTHAPAPDFLPGIADPIRDAVAWAMQVKPERRPQTVGAFLEKLHGEPPRAIAPDARQAPRMSTHARAATSPNTLSLVVPLVAPASSGALPNAAGAPMSPRVPASAIQTNIAVGEWYHVRLAPNASCELPSWCACCGRAPESFLTVAATHKGKSKGRQSPGENTWQVPYCLVCLRHVKAAKNAVSGAMCGMACGLSLAALGVATSNLYVGPLGVFVHFTAMAFWVLKHVFAEQTATHQCCEIKEAAACHACGQAISWKFKNPDYAAAFRRLNAGRVV